MPQMDRATKKRKTVPKTRGEASEALTRIITPPARAPGDQRLPVNFVNASVADCRAARETRWFEMEKEAFDPRFWTNAQADWYASVYQSKKSPVAHMQWIDWNAMKKKKVPLFDEIIGACERHGLKKILAFKYDWNTEIICQFYSTVYFSKKERELIWMTDGEKYTCALDRFAKLIQVFDTFKEDECIHDYAALKYEEMDFMYPDRSCQRPLTKGFLPFFKVLNRIMRATLTPKEGNSDRCNSYERNILKWVYENDKFNVFDFLYSEMWDTSLTASRSCPYAPYVMCMIENVTGKIFVKDGKHTSLTPQVPGGYVMPSGSSRAAAAGSSGAHEKKSGLFKAIKSLFTICRSMTVRLDEMERRQRIMYEKMGCEPPLPPMEDAPVFEDPSEFLSEGEFEEPPPSTTHARARTSAPRPSRSTGDRKGKGKVQEIEEEESDDDGDGDDEDYSVFDE